MADNTKQSQPLSNGNEELDLRKLFGTLVDNIWLIIGVTSIFCVIGVIYVLFATPIYESDALVQVEQPMGDSLLNDISQIIPTSGKPASSTEIELIQSRMVLGKTVNDLELDTVIEQKYFPIFGKGWARLNKVEPSRIALTRLTVPDSLMNETLELKITGSNSYVLTYEGNEILKGIVGIKATSPDGVSLLVSDIDAEEGIVFNVTKQTALSTISKLSDSLTVEDKGKDTGVLSLSILGEDPNKIRSILDSVSNNYLLQNVERKSEEAARSLVFLKDQLPQVRSSLDIAEDKLNKYRQDKDSVDLTLEAKSVLDTIVNVEAQINELTFKEAEISKLYTKEHPAYRTLLEKRQTLLEERDKLNKRVNTMPKTQQEILKLTRDVQAGQEIYMQLLNKQQELSITKASTVGNVRIVDSAATQPGPVSPKKAIIIIIATFLGGALSISIILIRAMLHKGIENPDELENKGISVYASIPLSEWQHKKDKEILSTTGNKKINTRSESLLAVGNPTDLAIEAIRSLRTSLHFAMLEAKNNVLMISGASPNIGKTFTSVNLSAVIAQAGMRVLLIDADMRKGYSHNLLDTNWNNGLSDILSNQIEIETAIRTTSIKGLDFIPRGQVPPNPSELLMNQSLIKLIEWSKNNYDIIIVDTPPILAVTDASIIGHHVGTTLMVVRFGINTVKEIEVSIGRFDKNGINVKGVIINGVEKRASSSYGDYGYYHYEYDSVEK
jgi:tyrosine-protein kinase Etk/Wzc